MIVSWNTTNACNMYCDHCYRDAGCKAEEELSTAEAKTLLEQIARANFKIMIFSGGEPLMRPDIVELVAYATSLGLRPVFGTNGTLITLDMAQKLKDAGAMGMGISLDSMDKEKHNQFRKFGSLGRGGTGDAKLSCCRPALSDSHHSYGVEQSRAGGFDGFCRSRGGCGPSFLLLGAYGTSQNH